MHCKRREAHQRRSWRRWNGRISSCETTKSRSPAKSSPRCVSASQGLRVRLDKITSLHVCCIVLYVWSMDVCMDVWVYVWMYGCMVVWMCVIIRGRVRIQKGSKGEVARCVFACSLQCLSCCFTLLLFVFSFFLDVCFTV